jgi:outer membrane protein assembly factor BamB
MKRQTHPGGPALSLSTALLLLAILGSTGAQKPSDDLRRLTKGDRGWSRFRGPNGSGVSDATDVPLEWSTTRNVLWKAELPGRGASSPILWEDRVYVTAYTGYGLVDGDAWNNRHKLQRHLLCLSSKDGKLLWKADHGGEFREHGIANFLALHGYASSTPVADATGVYVYHGGGGVLAYGHDGKKRWHRELGGKQHSFGSASSPILFEDFLIVHADIESQALLAFDKQTGKEVWRVPAGDQKFGDSWSTPLLIDVEGKPELVFHRSQGNPATLAAVDPRNGKPLWECGVLKDYLCPSPIGHKDVIYTIANQRAAAVRAGGRNDVGESHVLWNINKGSEVCTPIYHDGHLYWTNEQSGIAHCVDATNGKMVYQERLQPTPGLIYASGVLAEGRIYYVSREKGTYVIAAKPKFELLAHNRIEDDKSSFNGTPAIRQGQIFLRSDRYVYCIGKSR